MLPASARCCRAFALMAGAVCYPRAFAATEMLVTGLLLDVDSGWVAGARHCPSPNCNSRPADEVSLLVIHNISLPPGEFGGGWVQRFFQNQLPADAHPYFASIAEMRVSAHFLIERDGGLTQFVSCHERAWHAGVSSFAGRENCNDFSLGIELEGTDDLPYNEAQYATLQALTCLLLNAYPLLTRQRICGHSDIAPQRKTDPGPAFDWQQFFAGLPQEESKQ